MTLQKQALRALITGGTRGIGYAISKKLRDGGIDVEITGRKPKGMNYEGFRYHTIDFENRSEVSAFSKRIAALNFDILINNAGINRISPFVDIREDDFDAIQEVNVRTPFLLCQSVLPHMRNQKWGRIVNISSIFGEISKEKRASYSASKFALNGFSKALAIEVASQGILVNCVLPGFIRTDLTETILGENGIRSLMSQIPMGRLGGPEEVAELVAWLVSPRNTFLTGQNLIIDGGFTCV